MAGEATHILDFLLVVIDVPLPHCLLACGAIDTIQCPLTASEFGNWLVVIMEAIGWSILPRVKLHIRQTVVTTVMACIALSGGKGSGKLVDQGSIFSRSWGMAGRTAVPAVSCSTFQGLSRQV